MQIATRTSFFLLIYHKIVRFLGQWLNKTRIIVKSGKNKRWENLAAVWVESFFILSLGTRQTLGRLMIRTKNLIINLHYAMNVFVWCYHIMSRPAVKKKITSIEFHWGSKNSEFYHLISYSSSHLFYSAFILQYRSWNESLLYFEDVLERAIKFYRLVPKKNKGYINNLMPASWNI